MCIPHSHRQCSRRFSEREARLCFETPVPDQTEDRFTWTSKDWGQQIARFVTSIGGEVPAYIIEQVGRVPVGIAQGINDVLQREKKLDRAQEALRNLATLAANAPPAVMEWIAEIFKERPNLSAEALVNIMSYQHWIVAFENLQLFMPGDVVALKADADATKDAQDIIKANTKPWGPREYLQTLSYLQRRERFATLVASVIPDDAQKDVRFKDVFSDTDPSARIRTFADNQDMLVPALKKIYGLEAFASAPGAKTESIDEQLAREAIEQKFFLFDAGGKKLRRSDRDSGATALLHEELTEQLRRRPGRLTVAGIREQMELGNPPASLMLGAVNSGEVTDEDIQKAVPELDAIHTERQLESNKQRRNLEEVTRASRDELQRGAETMSQRFESAPGWVKLLIVGGLIGGVMKFPKTSALIGAIFAGQYFLMKDDNPLDTAGNKLQDALGFLRGKSVVPKLGNADAVSQLGEQILSFLPDQAHEQIDTSVTGFALLAGLDISLLAKHSEASDKSGRKVILRAWDQPLRTGIRTSLKDRGLDSAAASRFFPSVDPRAKDEEGNRLSVDCTKNRNLCETGDALAGVFFRMGRQRVINGTHANTRLDMGTLGIIEKARTENIRSGQYDDIGDTLSMMHPQRNVMVNIRDAYYLVMMEGKEAAEKRPGDTLQEVMRELAEQSQEELPGVGGNETPKRVPLVAPVGPSAPATGASSAASTGGPSSAPTASPSSSFTGGPSSGPTGGASGGPAGSPSASPTGGPAASPTGGPSSAPAGGPSTGPTGGPSGGPTGGASGGPAGSPSASPTGGPAASPTGGPSSVPTHGPSAAPTGAPTSSPSATPSNVPLTGPSSVPTSSPGNNSSGSPQSNPTRGPSSAPTNAPQNAPTSAP